MSLVSTTIKVIKGQNTDIRHYFIGEAINKNRINLKYLQSGIMLADILTNGLSSNKHKAFVKDLGFDILVMLLNKLCRKF